MRLWSISPEYLDVKGLTALWREALLAQAVILGKTRGYRNHPQLLRFIRSADPALYIVQYLHVVYSESLSRGYRFSGSKISAPPAAFLDRIPVTSGQLLYEKKHLLRKLAKRDPSRMPLLTEVGIPRHHDLFYVIEGPVESWEKI